MAWPMDHTITGIEENITKDISCFANAGSVECIKTAPARLELHWKNQTAPNSAVFSIQTQGIMVDYKKSKYAYRDFISEISSLQYAAEQFLCTIELPSQIISASCIYDENNGSVTPLFESINEKIDLIQEANDLLVDRTKVFFIRGAAGTGKTIAMKELTKKQAERFSLGKVSFLFLYIDAQSRALTRLDEAIAHDLDEFSLAFKYTAVKALVRNGLIVPIIDKIP